MTEQETSAKLKARIGLFQGSADGPRIDGFDDSGAHKLPRGEANTLVTLTFHVEQ